MYYSVYLQTITLIFLKFDGSPHLSVKVYDGENTLAPLLGRFTGQTLPSDIRSSGRSLFVSIESDSFVNGEEINMKYTAAYTCEF